MKRRLDWMDWMDWVGLSCVLLSATLSARLVWEQTVLTVLRGPQMVGFSLVHSAFGLLLFVGPPAGAVWAAATLVIVVRRKAWRDRVRLGLLGAFSVCIILLLLPYGLWQRLLVRTHAHRAYAGEYVSYAAATGDLATVKSFLSAGVPVDVRDKRSGATPLHGAAVEGQMAMIEYLLSKGADVNALNAYGDSPVQNALSMNHPDAVAVLKAHGGIDTRGSDAQRNEAIESEVRGDIERMEHGH